MQQALEALERGETKLRWTAITALKQALAEPEQEPVRLQCTTCGTVYADGVPPQVPEQEPQTTHWEGCEAVHPECRVALRRPLTHEEIEALDNLPVCPSDAEVITFVRKIERAHGIGEQHE